MPEDYSILAHEISNIEIGVAKLLDELVESVERSAPQKKIEEKSKIIAMEARRIASELRNEGIMGINEKAIELENLQRQTDELLMQMPDTIIFSEQKRWACELEAITANVHKLKDGMNLLGLAHLEGRQRANAEGNMRRMLSSTKERLDFAANGILHKKHAKKHFSYLRIEKIGNAIKNVREQVSAAEKEAKRNAITPASTLAARRMKEFISRELEGKIHVDWDAIRMSSHLTGRVEEWANNDINRHAVKMLFESEEMKNLVQKAAGGKSAIVANFVCKQEAGALMVEFDAMERTIVADTIMGKRFRGKTML
ncbi:MAG: hypothetical protein WC492_00965 [Candidatus Micrarchaeia archaeon]